MKNVATPRKKSTPSPAEQAVAWSAAAPESGMHETPAEPPLTVGRVGREIDGNLEQLYEHIALMSETIESLVTLSPNLVTDETIIAIRDDGREAVADALTNVRWARKWAFNLQPKLGAL